MSKVHVHVKGHLANIVHQHRLARNLINFFIVSNVIIVIIEITISLIAHFLFYSHPSCVDGFAKNRLGSANSNFNIYAPEFMNGEKKIVSDWSC